MTSGPLAPGAEPSTAGKTLLLTSAATFMAFLDTTIVNVAFPALHEDFPKESVTDLTWVVTSYGILFAALLTPAGRFADVLGPAQAVPVVGRVVQRRLPRVRRRTERRDAHRRPRRPGHRRGPA